MRVSSAKKPAVSSETYFSPKSSWVEKIPVESN
jgi:hypothetical protein